MPRTTIYFTALYLALERSFCTGFGPKWPTAVCRCCATGHQDQIACVSLSGAFLYLSFKLIAVSVFSFLCVLKQTIFFLKVSNADVNYQFGICVLGVFVCAGATHTRRRRHLMKWNFSWDSNSRCMYTDLPQLSGFVYFDCVLSSLPSLPPLKKERIFENCVTKKDEFCVGEKPTTGRIQRIWGMSAFLLYLSCASFFPPWVNRSSPPSYSPEFTKGFFRLDLTPCIEAWEQLHCCCWSRGWGPGRATWASPPCCSQTPGSRTGCSSQYLSLFQSSDCHCVGSFSSQRRSWCSSSLFSFGSSFESSRTRIPLSSPSPLGKSSRSETLSLEQRPLGVLESFAPWNFLPSSSPSWSAVSMTRTRMTWTGWSSEFDSATAVPWNSPPSSILSSPSRCSSPGNSFRLGSPLNCASIKSSLVWFLHPLLTHCTAS